MKDCMREVVDDFSGGVAGGWWGMGEDNRDKQQYREELTRENEERDASLTVW